MIDQSSSELPPKVFAEAVVRSASGESLLRSSRLITSQNVTLFHAASEQRLEAAKRLRAAGFEILDIGTLSINIAAPPEMYESVFRSTLESVERPIRRGTEQATTSSFVDAVDGSPFGEIDVSDTAWNDILDGVALNEPAYYLQQSVPSATPPVTNARYLQVPEDLAEELSARLAHEQGITGKGVRVVVIDSGCYTQHPFFKKHQYKVDVRLGPGSTLPEEDINGHGTGVAVNVLAIAPDVNLTVLKADIALQNKYRHVNSTAAFRQAVSLQPDVISCSWGSDLRSLYQLSASHKVLAAAIADAVRQGVVVVFAAGNGQWGFPSQHPDVIAVGGVYKHLEGSFKGRIEASNYASSFISDIYPNRRVPDVCGLVGRLPNATYIMLPVPPGSEIDKSRASLGDETEANDGWAAFSGTSSAAPQLAGACALMEQFMPKLPPLTIKKILQDTAIDVIEGGSNPATGAGQSRGGPDLATGFGLVAASRAVQAARDVYAKESQIPSVELFQSSAAPEISVFSAPSTPETLFSQPQVLSPHSSSHRSLSPMSLDESALRKLRKKIDEIQIELNKHFQDKFPELAQDNIELVIYEGNFVEWTSELGAIASLRERLREVEDGNTILEDLITKKHVSAAASLLQQGKCQDLSRRVLVKAISLKGKTVRYVTDFDDEVVQIKTKELRKLKVTPLASNLFVLEEAEIADVDVVILGETSVKSRKNSRDFVGKILLVEEIDRDEIAELAASALGRINIRLQGDNSDEYRNFDCEPCGNGKQKCPPDWKCR